MAEPNWVLWRGVRPISPEEVFTYYEKPEKAVYVDAYGVVDNTTVVIYTVPAGYTFHMTSLSTSLAPTAGGSFRVYVENDTPAFQYYLGYFQAVANNPIVCHATYPVAVKLLAGWRIVALSDANNVIGFTFVVGYKKAN